MDIYISFLGGMRVDAQIGDLTIATDQPAAAGGPGEVAGPFDLFLASIGTCVGYYVLAFCRTRGIPTEGLAVVERVTDDARTHLPLRIDIDVVLPPGFPEQHRVGVRHAAEHCKVKKVLAAPPVVAVHLSDPAAAHTTAA
jgi:ribosomal protein S12 methylthiotransferase accessory factor